MKREIGNSTILKYSFMAMGTGAIPVPGLDIAAVTGVQVQMLNELSHLFGVELSKNNTKALLAAMTGGITARLLGSAIKVIPGLGTIIGGAASVIASGASTYAIGHVFLYHFLSGGTIDDFESKAFKKLYKKKYKEGKNYMAQSKKSIKLKSEVVINIKDLISKGKTEEALLSFTSETKNNDLKTHSELIIHLASFNELESNTRLGIIDEQQQGIERNKINHNLLELLHDCSEEGNSE